MRCCRRATAAPAARLWKFLPYFTEITYSLPISVASVNQASYDALTPEARAAVDTAGRQTEAELWMALSTRLQQNYQRMREEWRHHRFRPCA